MRKIPEVNYHQISKLRKLLPNPNFKLEELYRYAILFRPKVTSIKNLEFRKAIKEYCKDNHLINNISIKDIILKKYDTLKCRLNIQNVIQIQSFLQEQVYRNFGNFAENLNLLIEERKKIKVIMAGLK